VIRKLLLCCAFVFAVQAFTATEAAAQSCGGEGQVPCLQWSWCAYTTPSLFGDVCWGGLVYMTSWAGCSSDRFNNWGLFCSACGGAGQPTCNYGSTCNTDQRYTPFGLCYPCGRNGQAACVSGASCDEGNRAIFGFCSYSGFSTEPTTNVVTMPTLTQSATGPVRGIADLHTHQFSNLGFGGVVFWGAPYDARGINYALPWCDYTWEFGTTGAIAPTLGYEIHGPTGLQALSHPLSNALPEGAHDVSGTGPFTGWPTHNTFTHQQMYYKWLERAYLGGVRLINQLMVSNEALCSAGKRRSNFTCNDMDAVNKEIQATKELEQAIDKMDDGLVNKTGWYQIAYSPSQARDIIRKGKLAVVLGIEVDSLFNCKPGTTCTREYLRGQLQSYYNQGIRHVFPIHQFDNAFGGAALFKDELNAGNIVVAGEHFKVRDCSAQGYTYNVDSTDLDLLNWIVNGKALPDQKYYDGFAADCNERGLTETGRALIEEMMDLKFIIDTDHMSRLMVDEVMTMAKTTSTDRPNKYPLVSSHTEYQSKQAEKGEFSVTDAQIDVFKEIGGIITAPSPKGDCNSSASYKANYLFAVGKMKKDPTDTFPGVAFSTDVNGFAGATGPRFGNANCPGTAGTQLPYPFTGIMGGSFQKQTTGGKTYDFNNVGGAHYGLLADFFADLKNAGGLTDADLDPLLNSAETYIRLWERVNVSDQLPPPVITPHVTGTLGQGGWFRSDVTVEWEVVSDPRAGTATKTDCGPTTISADTSGMTMTCQAKNPTGESSQWSVTIRRDTTPPTFTAKRLGVLPATGWTNQNVEVEFEASDALSGIGWTSKAQVTLTQEGENLTASYPFYDQAGNVVQATLSGINIDKTRPVIGFRFAHLSENATPAEIAAETLKWHNHTVTLILDPHDALSGVASVDPAQFVFTAEGINLQGSATVVDRAGNSATDFTGAIKIDRTPPTIQLLNRLPAANGAGWNKTAVEVNWECGDALSGVPAVLVTRRLESEGAAQTATQTCYDNAGNTASNSLPGISIDLTPPVVACEAGPAVLFPPNRKMVPVNVALTFTDPLSGPLSYAMTQLASSDAGGADDIAGFAIGSTSLVGSLRAELDRPGYGRFYTLGYEGRDVAGNTASCSTMVTVPRDMTQQR